MLRETRNRRARPGAVWLLGALLLALPAWAQKASTGVSEEARAAALAASRAQTDAVRARIVESANFLAGQKRFAFTARNTFDVLQRNDQMLEFGSLQEVTVRRPDRVRIDTMDRDGDRRSLTFDGKTIAVDLPDAGSYVSIEKPGSLEAAVEYLVGELGTPAPLHEFLTENYFDDAADQMLSGFFVDTERIGDQVCDHLAFRGANVDVQLWVRIGDEPLPCRIVITHADQEGHPQFAAEFEAWNLAPEVPDGRFAYQPPDGAERLTLQAAQQEIVEEDSKP